MTTYKATVRDKQTKESTILTKEYPTKKAFIEDIKANGYSIYRNHVAEAKIFDASYECEFCGKWHTEETRTSEFCY